MEMIERHVTLPAGIDEVWALLTRPDDLAAWLGDDVVLHPTPGAAGHVVERDGTTRSLTVDEVVDGHRLAWRWWPDGDSDSSGTASRVEITLSPTDDGTLVRVVEQQLPGAAPTGAGNVARASTAAGEAWSHRLLHLEVLLLVAAAVRG
jgi:uncharacterized protein YndB with AHSA1/START domain